MGKLDQFYREAYPSLLTYAMRILGDELNFFAEDCVQDSIYGSYQNRTSLRSASEWKSYLYTSVHNACISALRKQNSRSHYLSQLDDETGDDLINSIIEQEQMDTIFKVIEQLPPRLRRIFDLSFEQGMKNEEVAERLHLSLSGVKKQKRDLLALVKQQIGRQFILFTLMY